MSWENDAAVILRTHVPLGSKLLVAVSGGPDSVALAHFLCGQPYELVLGHVDHALRRSSRADARFVAQLARKWDLPLEQKRVPVRAFARLAHQGIEEAARTVRYQ